MISFAGFIKRRRAVRFDFRATCSDLFAAAAQGPLSNHWSKLTHPQPQSVPRTLPVEYVFDLAIGDPVLALVLAILPSKRYASLPGLRLFQEPP